MLDSGLIGTKAVPENVLNVSPPTHYSSRITKANHIYPFLMQEGLNMYLPIVLVIFVSRVSKFDYKNRSKVGLVTNYLAKIANFTRSVNFKNSLQCQGNIRKVS